MCCLELWYHTGCRGGLDSPGPLSLCGPEHVALLVGTRTVSMVQGPYG